MIVRCWEGRARVGAGTEYLAHLTDVVLPEIRALPGARGAQVLRDHGSPDHFMVLTWWADLSSIERFAGEDVGHAVVPSEARALLKSFDERVRHFEVVVDQKA